MVALFIHCGNELGTVEYGRDLLEYSHHRKLFEIYDSKKGGILVVFHRKLIRCTLYEYELAPYVSTPLLYYILNCITRNGDVININKYIHKNKQVSFLLATPWCS